MLTRSLIANGSSVLRMFTMNYSGRLTWYQTVVVVVILLYNMWTIAKHYDLGELICSLCIPFDSNLFPTNRGLQNRLYRHSVNNGTVIFLQLSDHGSSACCSSQRFYDSNSGTPSVFNKMRNFFLKRYGSDTFQLNKMLSNHHLAFEASSMSTHVLFSLALLFWLWQVFTKD